MTCYGICIGAVVIQPIKNHCEWSKISSLFEYSDSNSGLKLQRSGCPTLAPPIPFSNFYLTFLSTLPCLTMKAVLFATLAGSATAFVSQSASKSSTALNSALDDLKAIAEKSNPVLKYYDPLELANTSIWGSDQAGTIGFLRHSEIKHGRIAMAAFVGYIVQSNGIHWPWPMTLDGTPFPYDAGSPPEQWDALPDAAKWQIILFIGFLEHFSESNGLHYMKGGKPGAFPKFSDSDKIPHPVPLNLFDPFGFSKGRSEEAKQRGLISEINNGRLAQIGILGFLAEQKLSGSVPLLEGIVPPYAGEPMAPF